MTTADDYNREYDAVLEKYDKYAEWKKGGQRQVISKTEEEVARLLFRSLDIEEQRQVISKTSSAVAPYGSDVPVFGY